MFVDAETASCRSSRVHFTPSLSKWETSTPNFFIRSKTYLRVELFGSTPNRSKASDKVRASRAASSSRSRL